MTNATAAAVDPTDDIIIAFQPTSSVDDGTANRADSSKSECSIIQCAFTIVNTTVGAGIIGLPFAFKGAGFGFGLIMTFAVAYLTNAALILMIYTGQFVNVYSYAGLAKSGLGPVGAYLVTLAVLMNGLGTMVSYLIIIGSELPKLAHFYLPDLTLLANRSVMITILPCVFIGPLLFWKSIGRLKTISIIGVLCVPIIVLTVFYRSFITPAYHRDHQVNYTFFGHNVFPSLGVMSFAFVSNHTAFMSFQSLRRRTVSRWSRATTIALTASLLVSLSLAVVGYAAFGEDLQANVLAVFPANDNFINFASFVLALSMFVSYPMQFYPSRVALLTLIGWENLAMAQTSHHHASVTDSRFLPSGSSRGGLWFRVITIFLFAVTIIVAVLVEDLGKVYELVGAVCSSAIAFLLPGAAAFSILHQQQQRRQRRQQRVNKQKNSQTFPNQNGGEMNEKEEYSSEQTALLLNPQRESMAADSEKSINRQRLAKILSALVFLFGVVVLVAGTSQSIYSIIY